MHGQTIGIVNSVASIRRSFGGPSRSVVGLCDALSSLGHRVALVTQQDQTSREVLVLPTARSVQVGFVPGVNSVAPRVWLPFGFGSKVLRMARRIRADLLHDHGLWNVSNARVAVAARRCELPLIISPRGTLGPWLADRSNIKKRIAWALYQKNSIDRAAAFMVTSHDEAAALRVLGFKQPIGIIPNGVELPNISGRTRSDSVASNRHAICVARIHPIKGILELVKSWRRVMPVGWHLTIAGYDEGGYATVIKDAVRKLELSKHISVSGPVEGEAKDALFQSAELYILPTLSENFGIAIAEALSYGVPVITTTGAPWQELQEHGCGWWIKNRDGDLDDAIREATSLSSYELCEMGCKGRLLIETKYAWPSVAAQVTGFYGWILNGGSTPDEVV